MYCIKAFQLSAIKMCYKESFRFSNRQSDNIYTYAVRSTNECYTQITQHIDHVELFKLNESIRFSFEDIYTLTAIALIGLYVRLICFFTLS
jgi:hypothetical protein